MPSVAKNVPRGTFFGQPAEVGRERYAGDARLRGKPGKEGANRKRMTEPDLIIPPGPFGAYLFDLDGTVADSMPLHFQSWTQAVEEQGGHFPVQLFYDWGGIPLPRTVEMLNERFGWSMSPAEVAHRKEQLYLSIMSTVQPIASVLAVIEAKHGRVPFAIVSGSPHASIESTLSLLGLLDRFDVLVGAEDYTRGKPDPEPFLTAAARLGVPAGECLVFEDADAGIASAEAAGMQWVRIPHTPMDPALLGSGASRPG